MNAPALNQLDRDVIDSVLQMNGGYVLDFSDRTFAEFFGDFGVPIDDERYRVDGDSKARRLRVFLRNAPSALVGQVLAALLERRLLKRPDGLKAQEVERYQAIVQRYGGSVPTAASAKGPIEAEAELLRRVFRPELLSRLPLDAALITALAARMEEAQACIEGKALRNFLREWENSLNDAPASPRSVENSSSSRFCSEGEYTNGTMVPSSSSTNSALISCRSEKLMHVATWARFGSSTTTSEKT